MILTCTKLKKEREKHKGRKILKELYQMLLMCPQTLPPTPELGSLFLFL